jgi:hydroxyacylglutathione hydrolase
LRSVSLLVLAACTPNPRVSVPRTQTDYAIGTVTLGLSNVHVLYGEHPVLVDTGSPDEFDDLEEELGEIGVKLSDVKCAVVTHGHSDHAGNARELQRHGIRIIAGAADLWRMQAGEHGTLISTSFFARWILRPVVPMHFHPFTPDVQVTDRFDLRECGVPAEVVAMSGHTAGSLVVLARGGKVALVGDLFRGGTFAGYANPTQPEEHFYQDDLQMAHQRIHELLARGVELFVMGHGGPSTRAQVAAAFP